MHPAPSRHRDTCRLCGASDVEVVVPLRPIPITTPNIGLDAADVDGRGLARHTVPLDMFLCRRCGHFQLLDMIDPELHYVNFRYRTTISLGLPEHFRRMAEETLARISPPPGSLVLEIGSNDGTLLRAYRERGHRVLGIDPAREIAASATASGVETLATFFTASLGRELRERGGPAHLVVCNNTFANIDDVDDFVAGVGEVLAEDGVFVFETSYGADVVRGTLIDTVYHEHLSYFLVGPLIDFFARNGLELYEVDHVATKGGSLRGFVQRAGGKRVGTGSVARMIAEEEAGGFRKPEVYRAFAGRIADARDALHRRLNAPDLRDGAIAGYGASVGTVTLLHQFDLGLRLGVIYDDAPLADSLIGPDHEIPILRSERLYDRPPAAIVLLAWRYTDPITRAHTAYTAAGGRFLIPLPRFSTFPPEAP